MSNLRRLVAVGAAALFSVQAVWTPVKAVAAATPIAHHGRLGPLAQAAIATQKKGHALAQSRLRGRATPKGTAYGVFLRGGATAASIAATGAVPETVLAVGATADATLSQLPTLASLPGVAEVELAGQSNALLDVSVPKIHASEPGHATNAGVPHMWSVSGTSPMTFTGNTGKHTIVGVVDTGIDLTNLDFRTSSGTRIVDLWDQAACPNPSGGSCPQQPANSQGFTYGAECSQSLIDAGGCGPFKYGGDCETPYRGGTPVSISEEDCNGHGTHVAGIAASNGSAGTAGSYVGVAPEADLVIVKSDFDTAHIVDAVNYVYKVAASRGESASVNLSLGINQGPHDGTDTFEQMLDALTGPGRLLSVAAGNQATGDANSHYHASAAVSSGEVRTEALLVESQPVFVDIWYPGSDRLAVAINEQGVGQTPWISPDVGGTANPDGTCNHGIPQGDGFADPQGNFSLMLSCTNMPGNGDNEIRVFLFNPKTETLKNLDGTLCDRTQNCSGLFQILLEGLTVPHGQFNAWMFDQGDYTFQQSDGNDQRTIDEPATAGDVIAVGSFADRGSWPSLAGTQTDPHPSGGLSFFSGRGPTRDGRRGITIAAPGEMVGSSLSATASSEIRSGCPTATVAGCTAPDSKHVFLEGTSMAAPHVAGALALLLAQYPSLTPNQAKRALADAADRSPFNAGGSPLGWGAGKLLVGPGVTLVAPVNGPVAGGNQIDVYGVDLQAGVTMSLGGHALSLTQVSATHYSATVPAGSQTGSVDLVITNPDTSTATDVGAYHYGPSFLQLDGWGGLHTVGGAAFDISGGPYWLGWNIARGVALRSGGNGGYVLDGWGGVHAFGTAPSVAPGAYWPGWDIARGLVVRPDGASGYVLDGWGGIHAFGGAPARGASAYWPGWDIARGIALNPCDASGNSGYVLDGWGGVHAFGGAPAVTITGYWLGWSIARSIAVDHQCDSGKVVGWVLDGWGGIHTFIQQGSTPPAAPAISAYWLGWDIARSLVVTGPQQGYVVDGWGGVHTVGSAPALSGGGYWPGWDIIRGADSP